MLIHLALSNAPEFVVLAQFLESEDAAQYCAAHNATHVPYNCNNRDGVPPPAVGATYRV